MTNNINGERIEVTQTIVTNGNGGESEHQPVEERQFVITPEHLGTITHAATAAHNCVCGYPAFPPDAEQINSQVAFINHFLKNPDLTPAEEHERWIGYKVGRDNYTKGPKKDPVKRTHDMFEPYHQLSVDRQIPAQLLLAIVRVYRPYIIG